MKNIVLSSVVTALLVFSGCSDKEPEVIKPVEVKQQEIVKEIAPVKTEVVAAEASVVNTGTETITKVVNTMGDLEAELAVVYFGFDEFSINNEMQNTVSLNSAVAKNAASQFNIKLEGNCDEWGSDEYNFALGLKRAEAVKKALVAEGVDSSKITMVSFGESNPNCLDKTQHCWGKNRRVDFTLLP